MVIKRQGFTLVELLIVMAILAMMIVIMVGILNPGALVNKGYDARKKKDVNRIKIAFEEYYSDKKCYPTNDIVDSLGLLDDGNCGGGAFAPWLPIWPCDPKKTHYLIFTEPVACPSWFKVATKLNNLSDRDIPANIPAAMGGEITRATANYGVSSTNIFWIDTFIDPRCLPADTCFTNFSGSCEPITAGCLGDNCYLSSTGPRCQFLECKVDCCVGTEVTSCP